MSIWFHSLKKSLMEPKRSNEVQRPHTYWNPKRLHISQVSLLLWHKIVAIRCFIWAQACNCGQVVNEMKFQVLAIFCKIQYPATSKHFYVFHGLILLHRSNFHYKRCLLGSFWRQHLGQSLLIINSTTVLFDSTVW